MRRPYHEANPEARGAITPEKTPKHEALHAAVAWLLGFEPHKIRINKDGSGVVERTTWSKLAWQNAAIDLAPALVDDLSVTDADRIKHVKPGSRGYAWGWLKQNRRRIMWKANRIMAEMGRPGGTLWFLEDGTMEWKPRKRKNIR